MSYDLRADIRAILDGTDLVDPGEIADRVAAEIPASKIRAALRVTLRGYVRQVIAETRTMAAPNFQPSAIEPSRNQTCGAGGWKVRSIRDGWQRAL
jgi:hypothetical protein